MVGLMCFVCWWFMCCCVVAGGGLFSLLWVLFGWGGCCVCVLSHGCCGLVVRRCGFVVI